MWIPFFLKDFFSKLINFKRLNLFINEPVDLFFIENKKKLSDNRGGNISFSHRYSEYVKVSGINIIEEKVIRPYSEDDRQYGQIGHFYLQASN